MQYGVDAMVSSLQMWKLICQFICSEEISWIDPCGGLVVVVGIVFLAFQGIHGQSPSLVVDCDLDKGMIVFRECSNCVQELCCRQAMLFCLGIFLLHGCDVCSIC